MSNRVYTYTKITELKNARYFSEIAPLPQLAMSLEMKNAMAHDMPIFRKNIMAFSVFQTRLFPGWNTSGQRFGYYTVLNRMLREKIAAAKDKSEREWLFGCKKNISFAVNNMIRLEEAGVHPCDIKERDRDILLFLDMWRCLEEADDHIKNFRKRLIQLQDPEVFSEEVGKIFRFHGRKQMVWHGFQFFTPLQQFVYDCFIRAGYDIYALIQYEEKYPYANEIWDYLYRPSHGFPEKSAWIRQEKSDEKNPLGEIFETGEKVLASNIKMIKYDNTVEFVEDIARIKDEGFYIYCADDKAANHMLKDYFPERYGIRNLLAYPIGQFIYALHKMWDENRQCIVLSQDGLRKCFASGWMSVDGKSSVNYTEDLERLLPYFEGCHTVDEWHKRLSVFIDACENAVDVFAAEASADENIVDISALKSSGCGYDAKKQQMFGNPLKHFGAFSIKEDRVDAVIAMIKKLIQMADALFGKNAPVSIQAHMGKLDAMLYMPDGMQKELYLEEKQKVKQIFEALESDQIRDFMCYPGDLAAAMLSLMGDKNQEELNEELSEHQRNVDLKVLVFNIFQVESAPIAANGKVHICFADISRLPGGAGKYSWPVDEAWLKSILQDTGKSYIKNWIENNHLTALSNRYYTYAALKNDNVEISWIQKQGEKMYAPSPYVTLLDQLSDAKIEESHVRKLDLMTVSKIDAKKRFEKEYISLENPKFHFYDSELEYALCPMRFVYSYVLGDRPAYRNEYQQNRAIVRLVQSLYELLKDKYSVEQIAANVFELFPGIRKAEKRQMIDDAIRWPLPECEGGYTSFGAYRYTNYRLNMVFPDQGAYEAAKRAEQMMRREGRKDIYYAQRGTEGSRNCELCPHSGYCMEALFGVDYKEGEASW